MRDWRIVVPVIDRDMGRAMVDSVGVGLRDRVMVIDNCASRFRGSRVQVHRFDRNLGVAGSWNTGVRLAREQGATHVLFCSASTRFNDGGLSIDGLVERMVTKDIVALLPPPTYWHTALFDVRFFERVGPVDENFYPAYYEECDIERRALLLDVPIVDNGQEPDALIVASTVRDGHGVDALRLAFPGESTINYDALADYWQAKWGCHVDDRRDLTVGFTTPFGDPDHDARWWPPTPGIDGLRARYGIAGR